jgi:hypothetical protein
VSKVQKKRVLTFLRHEYFFYSFHCAFIEYLTNLVLVFEGVSKEILSTKKWTESGVERLGRSTGRHRQLDSCETARQ